MNNKILKNKKIILSFFSVAVSGVILVLALVNFSLAWFAKNNKVTGNGMNITVGKESLVIENITVYKYNDFRNDVIETTIPDNESINLSMLIYDKIFTERNKTNAIIIKIDLSSITAGETLGLTFTCVDGTPTLDHLSDVVGYRTGALDSNIGATPLEVYTNVVNGLKDTTEYAFRKVEGASHVKTTQIHSNDVTWADGKSLYVILDYSPSLIDETGTQFDGTTEELFDGQHGDLNSVTIYKNQGA